MTQWIGEHVRRLPYLAVQKRFLKGKKQLKQGKIILSGSERQEEERIGNLFVTEDSLRS